VTIWERSVSATRRRAWAASEPYPRRFPVKTTGACRGAGHTIAPVVAVDAEDYERRVAAAPDALDVLAALLIGELDGQHRGFSWWVGHSDWKTLALLADYLIQSVYGVGRRCCRRL
jgi:hypothetical protein